MSSSINKGGSGNASIVRNYNLTTKKQRIKCMHCRKCKQELYYDRNITSAMREHLKRKHVHVNLAEGEAYMSILVTAASHGDLSVVERALAGEFSNHTDIDDINEALLRAACHGQVECLKTLLKYGADPDCEDLDGDTPLMLAASNNFVDAVKLLISSGCDINLRSERSRSALHMAAWNRRPRIVNLLLKAKCELNARDRYGDTPLMLCARRGYADILEMLLKAGCDVNVRSNERETALHYAARQGHVDCVRKLVEHRSPSRVSGSTAAVAAAAAVDLEACTVWGLTPLMQASSGSSTEAALILIGAGADVSACDLNGRSVLHHAVRYNMTSLVGRLLELGADPNAVDNCGSVALFEAVAARNDRTVSMLVSFGCRVADIVGRATINGEYRWSTPLEVAVFNGCLPSARLLYEAGCSFGDCTDTLAATGIRSDSVRNWLSSVWSQPRPLRGIIRITVRNTLGRQWRMKLNLLPLPSTIIAYLSLAEETVT